MRSLRSIHIVSRIRQGSHRTRFIPHRMNGPASSPYLAASVIVTRPFSDLDNSEYHQSIFHMDRGTILSVTSKTELTDLVHQLDTHVDQLTRSDIELLLQPLANQIYNRLDPEDAAPLLQKIILGCIARLPSTRSDDHPVPSLPLYRHLLITLGNLRTSEAAQMAQVILDLMRAEHAKDPTHSSAPDRTCYKSLLRAWALSGDPKGPANAYQVLREMERRSGVAMMLEDQNLVDMHDGPRIARPDRACYNLVASAYARLPALNHPINIQRCRRVLDRMTKLYDICRDDEYKWDSYSYQALLRAYKVFAAARRKSMDPQLVRDMRMLVLEISQDPKLVKDLRLEDIWGSYVEALVKLRGNEQHAHDIVLALARKRQVPKLKANRYSWPRQDTMLCLAHTWDSSGKPEASERIQELVQLAVETPLRRPKRLVMAMDAWSRNKWEFGSEVADGMFQRYLRDKPFPPTMELFTSALKVWMNSSAEDAPVRAELIFQEMLKYESSAKRLVAHERQLLYLLKTWMPLARTRQRYRGVHGNLYPAEHIENWILLCRDEPWFSNDIGIFTFGIRAWAHQKIDDMAETPRPVQRAAALLYSLGEQHIHRLPPFPYNWVLETCAWPYEGEKQEEAYSVAMEAFVRSDRNSRTYVALMKVIKVHVNEVDNEHVAFLEESFEDCCARGHLSQEFVWRLVDLLPGPSVEKLFNLTYQVAQSIVEKRQDRLAISWKTAEWRGSTPGALLVENLPPEWSCNLNEATHRKASR